MYKKEVILLMKLKTVLVGCGDRTCVYTDLALHTFNAIEIVAAVDPDTERLKYVQEHFNVPNEKCHLEARGREYGTRLQDVAEDISQWSASSREGPMADSSS